MATRKSRATAPSTAPTAPADPPGEPAPQGPAPQTPIVTSLPEAAPLTPPAAVQTAPIVVDGEERERALPLAAFAPFHDLLWGDTREPADPDELFIDEGPQFLTLATARPVIALRSLPGSARHRETLLLTTGQRMDRGRAVVLINQLRAVRAAASAT